DIQAAEQFLAANARVLEWRLFERLFRGGEAGVVRDAVAAYRNPDGGVGHALEPDGRSPRRPPPALDFALPTPPGAGARGTRPARRRVRLARRPRPRRGRRGLRGPLDRGLAACAVVGARGRRPGLADQHRAAGRDPARGGGPGGRRRAPVAAPGHGADLVPDRRAW